MNYLLTVVLVLTVYKYPARSRRVVNAKLAGSRKLLERVKNTVL